MLELYVLGFIVLVVVAVLYSGVKKVNQYEKGIIERWHAYERAYSLAPFFTCAKKVPYAISFASKQKGGVCPSARFLGLCARTPALEIAIDACVLGSQHSNHQRKQSSNDVCNSCGRGSYAHHLKAAPNPVSPRKNGFHGSHSKEGGHGADY